MSDIDKIVALLSSDAVDKRIAAIIVLGELRPKGAPVVEALANVLSSGVPALQRHALDALAKIGARRATRAILPLLGVRDDDVRRAAVAALVSVGDDVLPVVRARMAEAPNEANAPASGGPWSRADERRSVDAVLAALGGKDAFHALLEGLAAGDVETAKAAAIAVRQQVRDADARQRRAYLAETEKFLERAAKRGGPPGGLAAGIKILGYLEDRRALPTLLAFARDHDRPSAVRQEALIALRFLTAGDGTRERGQDKAIAATL
ncbi:MAG TPA: HEAT repeat domain-containing protein, partial [Polyangiaceae bacterium]|nr:HEAT repeat domain-containing protein [Polyangiaceae bacterium]